MGTRYRDDTRDWVETTFGESLVSCPACRRCARLTPSQLTCPACGLVRHGSAARRRGWAGSRWLRATVGGQLLVVDNAAALDELEAFVRADLRERALGSSGWRNRSWMSRVPRWVKAAENREAVLAAISRLRRRIPSWAARVAGPPPPRGKPTAGRRGQLASRAWLQAERKGR